MFEEVVPPLPPLKEVSSSSPDAAASELDDWKAALRRDFDQWLNELERLPEPESDEEEPAEYPDLYSFYQQLALANAESRKANRRTAEAFSQWAETLARFESQLGPLRETAAQLVATRPRENELPRPYCLLMIELLDRMHRLAKAFQSTPEKKGWWGGSDAAWRRAWENQRQGFAILVSHFEELLKKEEVVRIEVMGRAFDPAVMMAVAVDSESQHPAQTVLEEVAPGYQRRGELLRPAQVKVSARR
jgi:molecular chaperone GrpE (heat shock protein)